MKKYKNKKIFFEGRANQLDKEELIKYLSQNEATFTRDINEADMIIDTFLPYLEDQIYLKSLDGIEVIELPDLEKEFSEQIDLDSVLMAIKISKDQQRLIKLMGNDYFSDDVFLVLLKFYDWNGEGIHDTDENRDVSTALAGRFCKLQEMNHNVKHSPTAIYYTALETTNPKLLELLYNMPEYKINDKNALSNQPLSTYEVVALNPNISKPLMMQILKNVRVNELRFLASNKNIGELIKKELLKLGNKEITTQLIIANNLPNDEYKTLLQSEFKNLVLRSIELVDEIFEYILKNHKNIENLREVSKNRSLQSDQIEKLLELEDEDININLLKLNTLMPQYIEEFLQKENKFYNISLAHNETLTAEQFQKLSSINDLDVDISLSCNHSTPKEILSELFNKNNDFIKQGLASNKNTPIDILMHLQLDNKYSTMIAKNETYKEYSRNALGIGGEYNSQFKRNTYEQF